MKYFAMIDGRRYGPMELEEMVREGVRPDTYVWCKGMEDWEMASEVPDICRYFRQRLSGTLPSQMEARARQVKDNPLDDEEQERLLSQLPPMARNLVRKSGIKITKENLPAPENPRYPKALPIILYVICLIVILIGFLILH